MRSRGEEIRQSNCNAYINCSADLNISSLLARMRFNRTWMRFSSDEIFPSADEIKLSADEI